MNETISLSHISMEWYDYVRILQASIALLALYFLGRSFVRRGKDDYSKRLRDFWWVMSCMLFVFTVGPLEQLLRDREESWTLFVSLFAAFIALKAALNKERTLLKSDNGR